MAQGEATQFECAFNADVIVDELFNAIPKSKRPGYLGHMNDLYLFLEAVQKTLPMGENNRRDYYPEGKEPKL